MLCPTIVSYSYSMPWSNNSIIDRYSFRQPRPFQTFIERTTGRANFCYLNHFCHSSPVLSIRINHFVNLTTFANFDQLRGHQFFSKISTTCVAEDEVTTFLIQPRPLLSTAIVLSYLRVLCSLTLGSNQSGFDNIIIRF